MLVIDIGNSRIKWRVCHVAPPLNESRTYSLELLESRLSEWFDLQPAGLDVVICSVASIEVNNKVASYFINRGLQVHFVASQEEFAGVRNAYADVSRLGADRWVAIVSAFNKYKSAVCIVDAGTAVTIDVVDAGGQHLGGLIVPGLNLMRQSLLSSTAGISEVSGNYNLLADNTSDAVQSGCLQLLASGVSAVLDNINRQYELNAINVLTGGDASHILPSMRGNVVVDDGLLLDGLERYFARL